MQNIDKLNGVFSNWNSLLFIVKFFGKEKELNWDLK